MSKQTGNINFNQITSAPIINYRTGNGTPSSSVGVVGTMTNGCLQPFV